jgi:hypothetical protein
MGILFAKPLTKDDLVTKDVLVKALEPINKKLDKLVDSLLAEDGDEKAKNVTVAVCCGGTSHPNDASISCHGCIVRLDDNRIFLLSAAHSIVDLTYGHGGDSKYCCPPQDRLFCHTTK